MYFCDRHSPWQRPTNENANGLLRQYVPRAPTCHSTAPKLTEIARSLNNRPHKSLGYVKPSEKLTEHLAQTG